MLQFTHGQMKQELIDLERHNKMSHTHGMREAVRRNEHGQLKRTH